MFRPLLNLTLTLLRMGVFRNNDIEQLLIMIDPAFLGSKICGLEGKLNNVGLC